MKTTSRTWIKMAVIALIGFVCICWAPALKDASNTLWSEMIWFFAVTYFLIEKYGDKASYVSIATAAITGAVILPLTVIIFTWPSALASSMFILSTIVGISLAVICDRYRRPTVYILAAMLMVLLNSFAFPKALEGF